MSALGWSAYSACSLASTALAVAVSFGAALIGPTARGEAPKAESAPPTHLDVTIVSYNVHGLPLLDAPTGVRFPLILKELAGLRPDVVCFQEVWGEEDATVLTDGLAELGLVHATRFPGKRLGSGLLTVSRFPIRESRFAPFSENGNLWRLVRGHADALSEKGAGVAVLETPLGTVSVLSTHFVAADRARGEDLVEEQRMRQVEELVAVCEALSVAQPLLLCGDLNSEPGSPALRRLTGKPRFTDPLAAPQPRLDYVLVRGGTTLAAEPRAAALRSLEAVPAGGSEALPLSDHPAVVATLRLRKLEAAVENAERR